MRAIVLVTQHKSNT